MVEIQQLNKERNRYSKLLRIMNPYNIHIADETGLLALQPPTPQNIKFEWGFLQLWEEFQ